MSNFSVERAGTPAQSVPRAWSTSVAVLALIVVTCNQTWRDLWPRWTDWGLQEATYTHGILVVLVSVWLVWRARARLVAAPVSPVLWASPIVLLLSLAWLVAARGNILTVHASLWPALAWATILAACGRRAAAAFAFPLAYLWLAVPIWGYLNGALQSMTVLANGLLLKATGVPAVIIGNSVILPNGRFEIEGGCSGLHFFIVSLAISTLAGELHQDRIRTRFLFVALGAALAVLSNWARVYTVILAGYLTDMKHYLVAVDHYNFGWLVFAVAMVLFFTVMRRFPVRVPAASEGVVTSSSTNWRQGLLAGLAAVVVLPAVSWAAGMLPADSADHERHLARPAEGFSGPLSPSPAWQPFFVGATSESRAAYVSPTGHVLDYYGNNYTKQSQGRELIGYDNRLMDSGVFDLRLKTIVNQGSERRAIPTVAVEARRHAGQTWIVMYYYDVAGTLTSSELGAQLLAGWMSVWGPAPAGVRAVGARCQGDQDCDLAGREAGRLLDVLARDDL